MTSYYALLNKLETFFNNHLQVKKFGGEFREQMPNFSTMDERYPLVYVVPTSEISGMNTNVFTLEVYCVDIIQKDRANINTILSDTQLILNDLYLYYTDGTDLSVTVLTDPTMTPLNNFDLDYVAGWVGTFTFEVDQYSVCAIPVEPITPSTPSCEPASYLVEYENGTDIQEGTIPSGGSLTIQVPNPTECLPATVELINTASTLLLTESVDCDTTEQIIAPDGLAKIKLFGDGTLVNLQVPSGGQVEYDIPDNNITVNGGNLFTIDATEPLDIRLKDQNGATLPAQSVSHNQNQDHVNIVINTSGFAPVGATLMKTGQTTSYRTGDDGDLEAGRATSFLVLPSNNPFGNTNRFTSELGTQTYTNNIVIDWSTYNGSTVLGYRRTPSATTVNWNGAIDGALAVSIGTFTTGWRLTNIRELMNIINFQNGNGTYLYLLQYAPFNIVDELWSSTTLNTQPNFAWYVRGNNQPNLILYEGKGGGFKYIPCRTFTVTGTTLT
jgi:hypothetical protein